MRGHDRVHSAGMQATRHARLALLFLSSGFIAACGPTTATAGDGGGPEIVPDAQVAEADAGTIADAGPGADAGLPDSGNPIDAGSDAGELTPDASMMKDAGTPDAGSLDAGLLDGGCQPEPQTQICAAAQAECGSVTVVDCGAPRTVSCGSCSGEGVTCGGGGTANQCGCTPRTDAELCSAANAQCGTISGLTDNCGQPRTASCGACIDGLICGLAAPNQCGCAETDADFCAAAGADCGSLTAIDSCGQTRTVDCGDTCPVAGNTCAGGGVANQCGCTGDTDAALCSENNAQCGSLTVTDGCGVRRTIDCGTCSGTGATCGGTGVANRCGCAPETSQAFCTDNGADCGSVTALDNCGNPRSVYCGVCSGTGVTYGGAGTANQCGCTAESDAALCTAHSATCGSLTATDNCGATRTVSCGSCSGTGVTCGGGGSPNACGCTPETNAELCAAQGATCGSVTAADNCGTTRTISCGGCSGIGASCGGAGMPNQCGCTPESDATLCSAHGASCGTLTATDNCGASRSPNCGTCSGTGVTCGGGSTPNQCGCTPESDAALCANNGAQCGAISATDRCGTARTPDCGGCTGTGQSCGGSGSVNVCGCTPESDAALCAAYSVACGAPALADNCGLVRSPDCGPCGAESQDMTCQTQLLSQWATNPPAVGMGTQSANSSYDAVFEGLMSHYDVPGGAVAVTYDGHLVYTRAWGMADTASNQPTHPAHLFRIASLSKQLTATAVLQLVQAGMLSLDDPAFAYIPNLQPLPGKTMNPALSSITIRQLLNHTGGWNRDSEAVGDPMFDSFAVSAALGEPGPASADDTIRYMLDKPITYTPGTTYCYSNFGYAVLGAIIEQLTGTNYPAWMQQQVMGPQNIADMIIGPSLASGAEEVTYYDYPGDGLAYSVFPPTSNLVPWPYGGFNMQALEAHGGWIASPIDMMRFTLGVDEYAGHPTLITSNSLTEMLANPSVASCNSDGSTTPTSSASWYGFGFQVNQYGNYWHTGSLPGTATEDVIANNQFHFAAFFNSRPSDANFFNDLDADLWVAFEGVSTWSTEDYFDQYGTFSSWLTPDAYAAQVATSESSGQYPARAEGQLNGSNVEYRAVFSPLHAGSQSSSYAGLDCVAYQALATQYAQQGVGLVSLQTFTDADGLMRFQATWKSY